jgi:hypothetical protein
MTEDEAVATANSPGICDHLVRSLRARVASDQVLYGIRILLKLGNHLLAGLSRLIRGTVKYMQKDDHDTAR